MPGGSNTFSFGSALAGAGAALLIGLAVAAGFIALALSVDGFAGYVLGEGSVRQLIIEQGTARQWLEVLSFIANIAVALVAWFALGFARKQALEAEHARLAHVYLEISGRFLGPEISESRVLITVLMTRLSADDPNGLPERVHAKLHRLRTSRSVYLVGLYAKYMQLIVFFEDVAVLVRLKHVRYSDIYWLMKDAIVNVHAIYAHHLEQRRVLSGPLVFAELSALAARMAKEVPTDGGPNAAPSND
ncbi:MAG: hypothetical protein WDM79_16230 [Terricaulis sp.]